MPLSYLWWSEDNLGCENLSSTLFETPFLSCVSAAFTGLAVLQPLRILLSLSPAPPPFPCTSAVIQTLSLQHPASTWVPGIWTLVFALSQGCPLSCLSILIIFQVSYFVFNSVLVFSYHFTLSQVPCFLHLDPACFVCSPRIFQQLRLDWGCASLKQSHICFSTCLVSITLVGPLFNQTYFY